MFLKKLVLIKNVNVTLQKCSASVNNNVYIFKESPKVFSYQPDDLKCLYKTVSVIHLESHTCKPESN